ncbi:MAG: hypothetical protein ACD_4C00196G0001 [uncultured bacterium (gcode 4)]|uniref:Uncharacterized protein n=1 Tax=uncultured bacterium (gcode 4) TaxID=1234023 RepID=K2G977_9BACT|nr:MAG: hypothetical protein ACD_4C00196G0001 [uncultured bacterium (gcode 4)]
MKILFIPWFWIFWKNLNLFSKEYNVSFLEKYSDLKEDSFDKFDLIIAHSLWCLYLGEVLLNKKEFEYLNKKIVLYNPIIESNKTELLLKNLKRKEIYSTLKWLRIFSLFIRNCIFAPKEIWKQFKKIIEKPISFKIDLYNNFENIYLSKNDEFSAEYFGKIRNAKEIQGCHDEIYFDEKILKKLIEENPKAINIELI